LGLPRVNPVAFFCGDRVPPLQRVACYIDGFNLYHAIDALGQPHLKWVNLRRLAEFFVDRKLHDLIGIYYFSAYATWLPGPYKRHREYVKALRAVGVETVMSEFYEKPRSCHKCGTSWTAHEEKQSDVKAAVWLVDHAYQDQYDRALLMTGDSDLTPAVRTVLNRFPKKRIRVICPPGRHHSKKLIAAVTNKNLASIQTTHLARSLFPEYVTNERGEVRAVRPESYRPPVPAKVDGLTRKLKPTPVK
jgi:uncharacterized LabA/DUF88 family protein